MTSKKDTLDIHQNQLIPASKKATRRKYTEEQYAAIRAEYELGGITLKELAFKHKIPFTSVQNMVSGRTRPTMVAVAARKKFEAPPKPRPVVDDEESTEPPPKGAVAAAIEENRNRQKLAVESLATRLARELPRARIQMLTPTQHPRKWRVTCRKGVMYGPTEREAVERAIALWGAR